MENKCLPNGILGSTHSVFKKANSLAHIFIPILFKVRQCQSTQKQISWFQIFIPELRLQYACHLGKCLPKNRKEKGMEITVLILVGGRELSFYLP